jgi:hypothetical protein
MSAPQTVLTLIENFDCNLNAYRHWAIQRNLGQARLHRPHVQSARLGHGQQSGLCGSLSRCHPRRRDQGWPLHPRAGLQLSHRRTTQFFPQSQEASVNVKEAIEPAFQVRRYAWSAKLPLSLVTDFKEFAIMIAARDPTKMTGPAGHGCFTAPSATMRKSGTRSPRYFPRMRYT